VGSQRIMSKLATSDIFSVNPTDAKVPKATYIGNTLNFATKYNTLTATVKARYDSLGVAYNGVDNKGATFYKASPGGGLEGLYYYHSDQLGSANYITDANGDVAQHLEYIPYGETFVDERYQSWHTPYQFNGKERDEETGLTYYGARYFDGNVWLSVDPLAHKYPNVGSYVYCMANPVKYVDPDGMDVVFMKENGTEQKRIVNEEINKTYVVDLNSKDVDYTNLSENGGKGWIEARMPGVIPNCGGEKTDDEKYQKYDYLIASEASYFNQHKNNGETPSHTNGKTIDDPSTVPDLDPTLIKAMIMQETRMGTFDPNPKDNNNSKSDIMQANVYYSSKSNDWSDSKAKLGLSKGGGAKPNQSVHAGIGILFQKGLSTSGKHTSFRGWNKATDRYNGGGVPNYGKNVRQMVKDARR